MSRYHDLLLTRRQAWSVLAVMVVCEIGATLATKASDGFTRALPGLGAVLGFALTTLFLAKVLEVIPTSIAYTVWTGAGTASVALLGVVLFGDHLNVLASCGIALIVTGVLVLNRSEVPVDPHPTL